MTYPSPALLASLIISCRFTPKVTSKHRYHFHHSHIMTGTQALLKLRDIIRLKHLAISTKRSYHGWMLRFIHDLADGHAKGLSSDKKQETLLKAHRPPSGAKAHRRGKEPYYMIAYGQALFHGKQCVKRQYLWLKISLGQLHPTVAWAGEATPSEADIKVTRDLIRAGQLMKIEVLDHVIMGRLGFSTLRELGYFYQ